MSQSENIGILAEALAKAQGQITGALKDSSNPFFKSKYADLASVWDACRGPLSENGLAVIQTTEKDDSGITVKTTLAHSSGQYISGVLTMRPKDDSPQAYGSCLTYARRYALAAIVGVAQVDDDGNAATGHTKASPRDGMDLESVDQELATQYALDIRKALQGADEAKLKELHETLRTQQTLYTVTWDKLKASERADLRKIVSKEKAA